MLLLLSYLYASIRRENHVLYEFVRVCSQNEKHIMISDMIQTVLADMKLCKRPTYHVTFEEPCFNKHYYYEAYESLAHYFVLLSSGPDRLLKSIAFTFMFLPILSLGINLGFDMYDAFTWYGTISDTLKPRLIAELVLFITVLFLSINSWVITGKIITSLQVWNIINNTYIAPACRKEGLYEVEMEKLIVEQKRYAIQLNSDNELVCFIPVE